MSTAVHMLKTVIRLLIIINVKGSHFCGSTISWKPSPLNPRQVLFQWQSAWTFGQGPCGGGCSVEKIGKNGTSSQGMWQCLKGCSSLINIVPDSYIVTDVSESEGWEQGANSFSYTFPSQGNYIIGFTGGNWRSLSYGGGNDIWRIQTEVILGTRSDTGRPNNSPVIASKGIYRANYGSRFVLKLGVADPDGDHVRCRWAEGADECASVCRLIPNARLDEERCILTIPQVIRRLRYYEFGWYAVALTVEDFPRRNITQGGMARTVNDPLSAVPLQFLIQTPPIAYGATPPRITQCGQTTDGATVPVLPGGTFRGRVHAIPGQAAAPINAIHVVSPAGTKKSVLRDDSNGIPGSKYVDIEWTPGPDQVGESVLCCEAVDERTMPSQYECIKLRANDIDECSSNPCGNGGNCSNMYLGYTCTCLTGFSGVNCEIEWCGTSPCVKNITDIRPSADKNSTYHKTQTKNSDILHNETGKPTPSSDKELGWLSLLLLLLVPACIWCIVSGKRGRRKLTPFNSYKAHQNSAQETGREEVELALND